MGLDLSTLDWKGYAETVYGLLKAKLSGYLKDHADAEAFLKDCAEQIGKLTLKLAIPGLTPEQEADVRDEIASYKEAMQLEADSVILDVEGVAKSTLLTIVETAIEYGGPLIKMALKAI